MTKRLRVLVIEDSPTVRQHLVEVLSADPTIDVIGQGSSGEDAIRLVQRLRPDVVTMDMMLDGMDGQGATEQIMAYQPTPILVVSSSTNRAEAFRSFDALAAGAVDLLEKPNGDRFDDAWETLFRQTVKLVSRIKVITHPRARLRTTAPSASDEAAPVPRPLDVVAIGASTGGPGAVAQILQALPADFPAPIALVMHIAPGFAEQLAAWLARSTTLPVRIGKDGDDLRPNGRPAVTMAPATSHLIVRHGRYALSSSPERNFCRPSVDELFESVAREHADRALGLILTGMGRDGADGLLAMRRAGAITLGQDEASCVVYGMPRQAAELGAVRLVVPLARIGSTLAALALPDPRNRR